MLIKRTIQNHIINHIQTSNKIVVIYGPRQVGKTTLVQQIVAKLNKKTFFIDADLHQYTDILSSRNLSKLTDLVKGYEIVVIDEAQRIPNIGINLKIIHDHIPSVQLITTGSSSFSLANKISEPLTGRKWSYILYPIAFQELKQYNNSFELDAQKEDRMIWGSYPEVINIKGAEKKKKYIQEISADYLYKDIFEIADIQYSSKIRSLLQLIAFQIGNEVLINELASSLELHKNTVSRYIDLLEKSFVLKRLTGFSRNLRKEITKNDKIYFYDLGIRNAIIDNFKPLNSRNDVGELWENFIIMERFKKNAYTHHFTSSYFWRTYTGAEIDYVEEHSGKQFGFEIKWKDKKISSPKTWQKTYPDASWQEITKDNYLEFVI